MLKEINIRDEFYDEFPEEKAELEYQEYEKPFRFSMEDYRFMSQTTIGPCEMSVQVSHNGYVPGDSGHGGFVEVSFVTDYISCDSFEINKTGINQYTLRLQGEWERKQFITAMKHVIEELDQKD